MATKRFLNLERRLHKDAALFKEYKQFVDEYLQLKHMRLLNVTELNSIKYVMPHHCVIKPDSSSTRLRVVFDASAKSNTNYSLNDIMMVGPVIQNDLFTTILRFRKHNVAMTADVFKMYRQILVDPSDCIFQNIVWRDNPNQRLQYFQLQTVTYGTAAAPFLATRSLLQLAIDEAESYPLASNIIKSDFYVDDLITGANTLTEAKEIKSQIEESLQKGGFQLRKWCTNNIDLLKEVPDEHKERFIQFRESDIVKTLGLIWNPQQDEFNYKINIQTSSTRKITKRSVLADIGKLFDPMGFINPVVVLGKIFMQQLWKLKLNWDESLPEELHTSWLRFKDQLHLLESFQVPRRLHPFSDPRDIQLHAFSDASERAYGACLYLRCVDKIERVNVQLICAKSRVARLQHTTIPRLELCAAQLMTQLVVRIKSALSMEISSTFYWTDSKIVLAWIAEPSSNWCTFVANRIANIQEMSDVRSWRHIETKSNPADLISRGVLPKEFIKTSTWLKGPHFLYEQEAIWTDNNECSLPQLTTVPERRKVKLAFISAETKDIVESSKYVNAYLKIQNVFSYVNRFLRNLRASTAFRYFGPITVDERETALKTIIKIVQQKAFMNEYKRLMNSECVGERSSLKNLATLVDNEGIIRVGGRLENSTLSYDAKHPMLLPSSHPFVKSLLTYIHRKHMHAGPQTLLALTRQRFWPLRGGSLTRHIVHSCIRCFRTKPRDIQQLMGNLPPERVQPNRPFVNSGVDFCGPFYNHLRIRGKQPIKTYVAVFICFSTKAVHLELVNDLSSGAFLAAVRRFIGRRGLCANLYCDNATNFIGANNELKELRDLFCSQECRQEIIDLCSKDYIKFHFIPPRSPHFGGLWEAAVKSAKYHLRRVVQGHSLTFEELHTLVVQAESILNSRPLLPLSSDANDLAALTPGHFLIGEPLTAVVHPDLKEIPLTKLNRWQRIQYAKQQFWDRWSKSYLNNLQCRNKWNTETPNMRMNDLVLLKEDNTPAMKWILGRIVRLHPGADGKVRVVSIKTASGTFKRSVAKVCLLPNHVNNN